MRSIGDAAGILALEVRSLIECQVVKIHDGTVLLVPVPEGRRISWPKPRSVVRANKLQLRNAEVVRAATGYERGSITPLGGTHQWPVSADARIGTGLIGLGAGEQSWSALIDSRTFFDPFDAFVAGLSESEQLWCAATVRATTTPRSREPTASESRTACGRDIPSAGQTAEDESWTTVKCPLARPHGRPSHLVRRKFRRTRTRLPSPALITGATRRAEAAKS